MATTDTASLSDLECTGELTPFERNRYFYGKLLTVRDFEVEQAYFNEKRHLINRLVHGSGIVCGLRTQKTENEESGVTLSPGVAIDCCGRELVIEQEQTIDIRNLEGYSNEAENLYLCVKYAECLNGPVPSVANVSTCEEVCCYSRIQERFAFVLQETLPEPATEFAKLWTEKTLLYEDDTIKLERIVPRWVHPKEIVEITLVMTVKREIGPSPPALPIAIQLVVKELLPNELSPIQGLEADNQMQFMLFSSVKPGFIRNKSYLVKSVDTSTTVTPEIQATIDFKGTQTPASEVSKIEIITEPVSEKIVKRYFAEQLQEPPTCEENACIALAELVLKDNGTGEIEQLQEIPHAQYVYNTPLLYHLISATERRIGQLPEIGVKDDDADVLSPVSILNFGEGITAEDGGHGQANISAKVSVQDQGEAIGERAKLNFTGTGVSVDDDTANKRVNINISGGTGAVSAKGGKAVVNIKDGQGSVLVDSGFAHGRFSVNLGVDHGEYIAYGPQVQYSGTLLDLSARVFQLGSDAGKFQIRVNAPGLSNRNIPLIWWAIPGEMLSEPSPTITIPTPTFTITQPTITIPTTTPTFTFPTGGTPTFTFTQPTVTFPTGGTPTFTFTQPSVTFPTGVTPTFTFPTGVTPTVTFTQPTVTIPTLTQTVIITQPTITGPIITGPVVTMPTAEIPVITAPIVVTPRAVRNLREIRGIGPATEKKLKNAGIKTVEELASAVPKRIAEILEISNTTKAEQFIEEAKRLIEQP